VQTEGKNRKQGWKQRKKRKKTGAVFNMSFSPINFSAKSFYIMELGLGVKSKK
jgi:hypothetical protein